MTLAGSQALLHRAITKGAGIAPGRIGRGLAATPALSAVESVEIYAGMYLWRLVEALRETFPNLARCLGDEAFPGLARDYLHRHPSEHHDIGRIGRRLPAFLRRHPDPERPDLADLAELEWARNVVFFAAAAEPVGPDALARLAPEAFGRARLALAPALRVLALDHATAPLWRRLEDGEPPGPPAPGASRMAVWRRGFDVVHCPLALDEAVALRRAAAGDSLARVCAAFADRDDAAAAAHAALASWIGEGWVAGVEPTPLPPPARPPRSRSRPACRPPPAPPGR